MAAKLFSGTGNPNGAVFGDPGDVYQDETGALWSKASGVSANTGWAVAAPNAVIFDDAIPANRVNIRGDRSTNQSPIDNTKAGITNIGSATGTAPSTGATGAYSTISGGDDNSASGDYSTVAGGARNNVSGELSYAEGFRNVVTGESAHSEGQDNTVGGDHAHAEGIGNTVNGGDGAHAEGRGNTASGDSAHAEGRDNVAVNAYAHAEGNATQAIGGASHAEGTGTIAGGANSHAEGSNTQSSADNSHAEGIGTSATAQSAHAEGNSTIASGFNSHAEGRECTASAAYTHAQGYLSSAERPTQFSHASGNAGGSGRGEYQTSWLVFRSAPQNAGSGPRPLDYGDGPSNVFVIAANKAYTFRVRAICAGADGGGNPVLATIVQEFNAVLVAGVATIIAQTASVIFGSATAVANWTLVGFAPGGDSVQLIFNTNGDAATLSVAVTAHVEWSETPAP